MSTSFDHTDPVFRQWLKDMLKVGPITITFTKSDGTERVMKCTLEEGAVVQYQKKTEKVKTVNSDVLPVWDLDNAGWRSIRYDSIKQIEFSIGDSHE